MRLSLLKDFCYLRHRPPGLSQCVSLNKIIVINILIIPIAFKIVLFTLISNDPTIYVSKLILKSNLFGHKKNFSHNK